MVGRSGNSWRFMGRRHAGHPPSDVGVPRMRSNASWSGGAETTVSCRGTKSFWLLAADPHRGWVHFTTTEHFNLTGLKAACQASERACVPRMALIFQGLDTQQTIGHRKNQDMRAVGDDKRLELCVRLSYDSPKHDCGYPAPRHAPVHAMRASADALFPQAALAGAFFCSPGWSKAGEVRKRRRAWHEGRRCSFDRQRSLAPLHEG
jgi:hypothetical protein